MKKISAVLAALLALTLLAGCGADKNNTASVQSVAMICGIGSTMRIERFAGVIEPKSETQLKRDEDKTVAEIRVKPGDTVVKDQVLFTYEQEQVSINLERAQLELDQLRNTLTSKRSEISALEQERAAASADSKLSYTLEIQSLNAEITETNYSISAKEKEIEKIRTSLSNLEVKSPVNGQVQAVNENGSDSMGNPMPLITIMETGGYRVKGYINENNMGALTEGMQVLVRSRVDDTVRQGSITSVDYSNPKSSSASDYVMYDSGDDETVTSNKYPFYAELEVSDGFILGQHVYIEPDYGQNDTAEQPELPSYYINDADSDPWVWAQGKNGKLEKRAVTLGAYNADADTYPVADGLTAEDFIAFPEEGLSAGMVCVEYNDMAYDDDVLYDDGDIMYDDADIDGVVDTDGNGDDAPIVYGGAVPASTGRAAG